MRLFEYQAKEIFHNYGIPIPKSQVITNASLADQARDEIGNDVVLKAQLLVGGRAKIGGIRLVHPKEDIVDAASKILGLSVKGNKVRKILIEEAIKIENEFVIKLEVDPYLEKPVFIASKFDIKKSLTNGMEATENRIRVPVELSTGLLEFQIRKMAVALEISKTLWDQLSSIFNGMWKIFRSLDAERIEINPLIINEKNQFLALGALIDVEERAMFRQEAILETNDLVHGSSLTKEAERYGISIFQNQGNIGCIVNGDALGHAVENMLISLGGQPGIFVNIGGSARDEGILAGMETLFKNKKINIILIAIFGGLTRCDLVAKGIIRTLNNKKMVDHLVIYLNGTNSKAGISLLMESKLNVEKTLLMAIKKCIKLSKKENK